MLLLLAPRLVLALEITAEALLDAASSAQGSVTVQQVAAIAVKLCSEWPAMPACFVMALRGFWDDLQHTDAPYCCEGPVADFIAELVWRGVLRPANAVGPLRLHHQKMSSAQGRLLCAVLRSMQELLGTASLKRDLFEAELPEGDDFFLGIFPADGNPASVHFARCFYEEANLAWLCEHESFTNLAMLSDMEEDE